MHRQTMTAFAVVIGAVCFIVGLGGCGGGSDAVRQAQWVDFTMAWDAETQSMSVVDQVGPAGYIEINGVGLNSSGVVWNSGTKKLSGDVTITNNTGMTINTVIGNILGYDPSDQNITDDANWYYQPEVVPAGETTDPETWTFTNPNAVSFEFTVRISWY